MTNSYTTYPSTGGSLGIPTYASFASLPGAASNGDVGLTTDTGTLYTYNGSAWVPANTNATSITDGLIVNADVNASAAIAYSKLNLATSIVNGDISNTAAIAVTKLANGTANQILGTNSGATGNEFKTLSVGTSGTDFAISHGAGTIALNLPDASATARGVVTTGTQTIAGAKTLSTSLTTPTATATSGFNLTGASSTWSGTAAGTTTLSQDTNISWLWTNGNAVGTQGTIKFGVGNSVGTGGQVVTIEATRMVIGASTAASTTGTGALVIAGGLGVAGAIYNGGVINSTGVIYTSNTTVSTTPSNGALVVGGGVGVAGAINAGGKIYTADSTASTSKSTGSLVVSGGIGVAGAAVVNSVAAIGAGTAGNTTGNHPYLATKLITGTTGAAGSVTTVAHGITATTILGYTCIIDYTGSGDTVAPAYNNIAYAFYLDVNASNVSVTLHASATAVASKTFKCLIHYTA